MWEQKKGLDMINKSKFYITRHPNPVKSRLHGTHLSKLAQNATAISLIQVSCADLFLLHCG